MENISKQKTRLAPNPQAVAWLVVAISFLIFCITCVASTYGAYWFIFQSPVSLRTELTVSRGTVTVILADGTKDYITGSTSPAENFIAPNSSIQLTDPNAQAYVSFDDTYSGQTIADVFMFANSTLSLDYASRPRFEWSTQRYSILLSNATGHYSVDLADGLKRASVVTIQSGAGGVQLENVHNDDGTLSGGSFTIDALDQSMRLYTQSGHGYLYASPDNAYQVDASMQGTLTGSKIDIGAYPYIMLNLPEPGPVQGSFNVEKDPLNPPPGWACTNYPNPDDPTEPLGQRLWARMDEHTVIEMVRQADHPLGHAETSCEFDFPRNLNNPFGLDISAYPSLSIRIKMKIINQDVTTCGVQASECPVMLDIEYLDPDGNVQHWYQGFYSDRPPSDTSLLRCDSCPHDHEQISKNAWYIYRTGDLKIQSPFDVKPNDSKRVYLRKIRVYSSGHRYDVALSEVTVLGSRPPIDDRAGAAR